MIRPLDPSDYESWLPLWTRNCLNRIGDDVTAQTWARICDPGSAVKGLAAHRDGRMAGILHYIVHPTTGSLFPACYMQDVFVDEAFRRQGVAKALILALTEIGRKERWARLYWVADAKNTAAQTLYKTLGIRLDFTLHVLPLA